MLIGYRWFDSKSLAVAYPFGHGLTYSTFDFRDLRVAPGGDAVVTVEVRNTGRRRATAVPQLYVGMPEPREGVVQPPWQLKGFERVTLDPGERRRVRFLLDERAFAYWDTPANGWRVARGCYRVGVGPSSRDLPLQAAIGRGDDCGGGAALALPRDARVCASRRNFVIRLPRRLKRGARVTYAGRRATIIRGRRLRARIDLRGLPKGRVRVRVRGRTRSGRIVRQTRVYRLCALKPTPSKRWPRRRRGG
ncbi:MAG TPA: fibronectin type III-like domain-contianing protein [Solirubrobacteraceae bacterium]|nr:fibronectin type III-like domain-contianing protein [Solirubrobacteraceae bacterium]